MAAGAQGGVCALERADKWNGGYLGIVVCGWVYNGCTWRSVDERATTQRRTGMGAAARMGAGMVHVRQGEHIGAVR